MNNRRIRSAQDGTNMGKIQNAAKIFIERFGARAPLEADLRAEELLNVEDYQGRARWMLIGDEIRRRQNNSSEIDQDQ